MRNENNYCCITRAQELRLMGSKLSPRLPHDICNLISADQPPLSHLSISTAHSGKTPQVAGPGTRLNHLHSTLICGSRKDKESQSGNGPANGFGSLFLGLLIKMQQKHPY